MTLDWLWPRLSGPETDQLRTCLALFETSKPSRSELAQLAGDATISHLEKRFLPESPDQLVEAGLRHRVLIASVGLRPMPVVLSTLILQPIRLYLLHSQDSRRMAESIRDDPAVQALGLDPTEDILLREISLTDAPQNYGVLQQIVRENQGQQIVVDVSGGVKVMGVALATAAFWLRLPVVYLLGKEVEGIIQPFSERITRLQNPFVYFGSSEMRSIAELFGLGDYDAALRVCHSLRDTVGDVQTLGMLDILIEFVELYRDWDLFAHSRADDGPDRKLATRMRVVQGKMRRLGLNFADEKALTGNLAFLESLENTWEKAKRNNSEKHRLTDILAAAQRRASAGKYDDAVARCYRCLEMAASICLGRDCHLGDPKEPDLSHFVELLGSKEELQRRFLQKARYSLSLDTKRSLGLKDQMVLLSLSKDSMHRAVSGIFDGMERDGLMEVRNRSTLAHGTVPVSKAEYEQYEKLTRDIVERVFPKGELAELLTRATHPSLML